MERIATTNLERLLTTRLGLIIGPGTTKYPGCITELSLALAAKGGVAAGGTYLDVADRLEESGINDIQIANWIREVVDAQQPSSLLSHLSTIRWGAVLSAALDNHFEELLQQHAALTPLRQRITVLADPIIQPPPRSLPVFKLLGIVTREEFAYKSLLYIQRRSKWRHAVKGFADLVRGNPVLCLGMEECPWALFDLLVEMFAERTCTPSSLLLLADDPISSNSKLHQLVKQRVRLYVVAGTTSDVAREAREVARRGGPVAKRTDSDPSNDPFLKLRSFHDIIAIVNDQLEARIAQAERNQLLDLLFAPSVTRWDPYVYGMDFRRSRESVLLGEIEAALRDDDPGGTAAVLWGAAVTGKTVLLKRLVLELARCDHPVLWLKPWLSSDTARTLREIFDEINAIKLWKGKRVIVVMDDPLGYGSLTPNDVAHAARTSGVPILLMVSLRTSEWMSWDQNDLLGSLPITVQYQVPERFDDEEWERLPDYLVELGVSANKAAAEEGLRSVHGLSAQDTLCSLYYLLPQTRAAIASSIRGEYFRLGDKAGMARAIISAAQSGTEILKEAYEMVAVSDRYRGSLPVEVLVSALNVDYGEWIAATTTNSPAWGLLYSEYSDDEQTVWYRTRNEIVTQLIVQTLNGGTLARAGELRVLGTLLKACAGSTSPVYREFCVRVLVPHDKLNHLSFDEGLLLYDTALTVLPYADKTILHHKGLWVKNRGRQAVQAREILETALATPDYPFTNRAEANEHIHTSLAATALDALNQGSMNLEQAKAEVLNHLEKARSETFFNPRSVHVQAKLIIRLAEQVSRDQTPDYFALINKAVADVDHSLLLLQSNLTHSVHAAGEVRALETVREEVLTKLQSVDELKAQAEEIWKTYRRQDGFALAARKLYSTAQEKNKKFDVPFSYAQQALLRVEEAGQQPSPELLAVYLQIYFHWRVRRQLISGRYPIDWELVRDKSAQLLGVADYAVDPLHRYIYAVALAHLGDWTSANNVFQQIRQSRLPNHVIWLPRDFLLNPTGGVRWVQGVMRSSGGREYLYVEDLQIDFHVSKAGRWPSDDAITHAAIQFSFAGATAVDRC